jgi:hypothetical protein
MISWLSLVKLDCGADTIKQAGSMIKASVKPLKYSHARDLAYLKIKEASFPIPINES